jgi:L-aminopeptidase/D-esterase-like protein
MQKQYKIGHYTDRESITGCTVILCPPNTVASCYITGAAPGSRETALLAPQRKINHIQALFLCGGSAFGLNAAAGVVNFLEEAKQGYETGFGVVPIVPAAVIFDLNIGKSMVRPTADNAYEACRKASDKFNDQGSIGAGTGATVGKWSGLSGAMKGGLGIATITMGRVFVRAVTVINPVGDIVDTKGKIVAGAISSKGKFIAEENISRRWQQPKVGLTENTILCALLTNAKLNKLETNILSRRAQNGLARAVVPASTSYDGDIIFSLASGQEEVNTDVIYEIATEVLRQSIISGVTNAESLGGYPAVKDWTQDK